MQRCLVDKACVITLLVNDESENKDLQTEFFEMNSYM